MREIKFRCWENREWNNEGHLMIHFTFNDLYGYDDGNVYISTSQKPDPLFTDNGKLSDKLIIMQFTGLTDKYGKSIYAGDILQLYSGKYLVKWECNHYLHPLPYEEKLNIGIPTSYVEVENGKIIGNIYENPGLLGEK